MKLLVLLNRYKKSIIQKKVQKNLDIIKKKYVTSTITKTVKANKITNDKELVNDKYDSNGNQVKINIDNVMINNHKNNNLINYNNKQHNSNPVTTYNYYAPLDDSPKVKQSKKKSKMTGLDDNDDLHKLTMLSNYVSEMPSTVDNKSTPGWEGVGEKQREKQKEAIHKESSPRYLPKFVMPGCKPDTPIVATSKIIPLNIKLRPPEDNKQYLHKTRFVAAVLRALQSLYPDTYLATIHDDHATRDMITNPFDVPIQDYRLDNYLMTANDGKQFVGKIYLHTNTELIRYKISPQLRMYLAKEHIVLDENALMSIKPPNVGFLETTIPRNETLELHTKRLLKKLPADVPKFQLCVSSLYIRTGNRCRIIVMRADPENIPRLQEEMNKLNSNNTVPFFHWGEYLSLTMEQKENVINHQNKWNANVRSLLLQGFTTNADKHSMKTKDET
jgi:hypothetical protein